MTNYRDNFGAALAHIDSLKQNKTQNLPSKKDLLQKIKDLFISHPEKWLSKDVLIKSFPVIYRDGFAFNLSSCYGKVLCFYLTGFFWIRVGQAEGNLDQCKVYSKDLQNWVYIFCPSFRREIRKQKNWALLKGFENERTI